jgi:hypothetical protein
LEWTFSLYSVLAEWKLVIQMQIRVGRAFPIAIGRRRIRQTQPDRRHVDGGLIQNVFVNFRGGIVVAK